MKLEMLLDIFEDLKVSSLGKAECESSKLLSSVRKAMDNNSPVFQTGILVLVSAYFQVLHYMWEQLSLPTKKIKVWKRLNKERLSLQQLLTQSCSLQTRGGRALSQRSRVTALCSAFRSPRASLRMIYSSLPFVFIKQFVRCIIKAGKAAPNPFRSRPAAQRRQGSLGRGWRQSGAERPPHVSLLTHPRGES